MASKKRKAYQEQKQVRNEDPLMRVMRIEPGETWAFVEAGAQELLERDNAEADESGSERVTMKEGDAGECGGEQQEIDQYGNVVSAEIRCEANA
jgi:hypothetical protein